MEIAFHERVADLEFSGYSTTSTTTTNLTEDDHGHGCNWNDWSPVLDWEALSGDHDDFHDLIESMMEDNSGLHHPTRILQEGYCNSASMDTVMVEEKSNDGGEDFKGLRLVHLLMAAAEALTGVNKSRELARVILVRLKELVSPTDGTNMERLAAYFTEALQSLLEGAGGVHGKHMLSHGPHHRDDHHQTDVLAAFQLLQDMSPYVKFGHFTANQAILEAVAHDRRVHIVDYDIMEGIQWASLMQALMSRKDGPPAPHLRITALSRCGSGRRSVGTVQETGRRLIAFAASIGQPFSFHQYSVASFLSGAKTLNPRLVTLLEEEVGPTGNGGFVDRFMDTLHHYSAVYDSLEAGFPMQGRSRALVELIFLGPQISRSVARIYHVHKEEDSCSWWKWLVTMGFNPVNISFANHCQAKLLLGLFHDGYRVEELANNRLVLGWKSRRLLSASIWTSTNSDV
ncbi:hypothetical protein F0562_028124 [Nyssa sinensis]|uniref:Uncharacterized protein n=1 Tax=Nyssa sinensis TaxID=561372 RepID=A0A5J5B5I0_9ASTE|nr:hypothetical protein F0562_028124 [Nyssa sinensis]